MYQKEGLKSISIERSGRLNKLQGYGLLQKRMIVVEMEGERKREGWLR